MIVLAVILGRKLKFCMWHRSAPIPPMYEFKSNWSKIKIHDFLPLPIALKFGMYNFLTKYMKQKISKIVFFKNCAIASNFFSYFWADWA